MKPATPFLRKRGSCDRMHTHYTHGRWCSRSSSTSAAYTFSGPQVSHLVSIFTPLQDPAPGNRPSPQKQMNSRSASFDVRLSRLVNPVALLNTTLLNSEMPLRRPPERIQMYKPHFLFFSKKIHQDCFFVSCSQLCVCLIYAAGYQGLLYLIELLSIYFSYAGMSDSAIPSNKTCTNRLLVTKRAASVIGELQNMIMKCGGSVFNSSFNNIESDWLLL